MFRVVLLLAQPAKTKAASRGNNSFFNILILISVRLGDKSGVIIALQRGEKSPTRREIDCKGFFQTREKPAG